MRRSLLLLTVIILTACYPAPPRDFDSTCPMINNPIVTREKIEKPMESDYYQGCLDQAVDRIFK